MNFDKADADELEKYYSPSRWSKRYPNPDDCIQNHVKFINEQSSSVREQIPADLDVEYGESEKEKYDLFGIDLPKDAPIIFYIHGGYWQEEVINRQNSSFLASIFYKHKIKSFIIGYELCPKVTLEELIKQTENALDTCIKYAKSNGSKGIHLVGHSAGAHLACHFFYNSAFSNEKLLKSAFLIGGVYDLVPLLKTSYNVPLKLDDETAQIFSPMKKCLYGNLSVKFHVIVGQYDSPAFVEQSEKYHENLTQNGTGARAELIILENIDHFDIIENLCEENFGLTQRIITEINIEN